MSRHPTLGKALAVFAGASLLLTSCNTAKRGENACLEIPRCPESNLQDRETDDLSAQVDFDWDAYAKQMLKKIRRNWVIPETALFGVAGSAKVRFMIEPTGQLACVGVLDLDGDQDLALEAKNAVCRSAPFDPLPVDRGKTGKEGVTITFYYNKGNTPGESTVRFDGEGGQV